MKKLWCLLLLYFSIAVTYGQSVSSQGGTVQNREGQISIPLEIYAEGNEQNPDAAKTTAVAIQNSNIPNPTVVCTACNSVKITVPTTSTILFYNNNTFTLAHTMSVSSTPTRYVRSIKAELDYFEYVPDAENCMACNKNSATFGNILAGTIATVTGSGSGTHNYLVNYVPAKAPGAYPVALTISMPPTVNCCAGTLRICVRYIVTFDDCTVCSQMVCYEKKKTSTLTASPIDVNPN